MAKLLSSRLQENELLIDIHASRLDAANAHEIKEEAGEIWDDSVDQVVIDFENVEFIDSSGIGVLLAVYKEGPERETHVKLRNVRPEVKSMLKLLRLNLAFEIEEKD